MKKTVLLLFAVMAAVLANAQDIITLANGESFYATNIRFAGNKVFFTRISDNGNTRTPVELSTKDLSKIIYESGEEEYFRKEDPNAKVNYNNGVNTGVNNGNAVNVTVTGPTFNNNIGASQGGYGGNGGGSRPTYEPVEFLDNPRFNAYAEGVGSLFLVNNTNNTKFYFGVVGSAGMRLNNYLYVGVGLGTHFSNSNIKTTFSGEYTDYCDAPIWYLPIFAEVRGFYPITDDVSLFGQVSAGVEFNQFSSKREDFDFEKCGKQYLNLAVGVEIDRIAASIGIMMHQGMHRIEQYYDNYYSGEHSHRVGYYKENVPAFYLKVGYKFGE